MIFLNFGVRRELGGKRRPKPDFSPPTNFSKGIRKAALPSASADGSAVLFVIQTFHSVSA